MVFLRWAMKSVVSPVRVQNLPPESLETGLYPYRSSTWQKPSAGIARPWYVWSIPYPNNFGQAVPQCWWLPPSGEADRQCGRTAWATATRRQKSGGSLDHVLWLDEIWWNVVHLHLTSIQSYPVESLRTSMLRKEWRLGRAVDLERNLSHRSTVTCVEATQNRH